MIHPEACGYLQGQEYVISSYTCQIYLVFIYFIWEDNKTILILF